MYKKIYYTLFNAITDAIEQLERQEFQQAIMTLEQAQHKTEDIFIEGDK